MFTQEVTVNNEVGLHARPATYFIQKANEFKSGIWVEKEERRVNAKSLLGVLSLGIVKGTTITLIADGPDAKEAVEALAQLVDNQLGEYKRNNRKTPEGRLSLRCLFSYLSSAYRRWCRTAGGCAGAGAGGPGPSAPGHAPSAAGPPSGPRPAAACRS